MDIIYSSTKLLNIKPLTVVNGNAYYCMFGKCNAFVISEVMAVDASKKNAALNTIVLSNAANAA